MSPVLRAALSYCSRGWPVILLHSIVDGHCSCRKATSCPDTGKHPRYHPDLMPNGVTSATTDPRTVITLSRRWPCANVGIATGTASGFFVLDVDPRHGGDGSLADLEERYGQLPETIES